MRSSPRRLRICLAASAGGHLEQLLKVRRAWANHEIVFVTSLELARSQLEQAGKTYVVGECNREHALRILLVFARCLKIATRERFQVVVSTGAAPGLLMCLASKLVGARVIWIDSIANVERLSMSGSIARHFADLILTQWPEVAKRYQSVEYSGALV